MAARGRLEIIMSYPVYTQNLHFAGICSSCGPTMVSRQGMPGFAPATWHCDICVECGPGIRPQIPMGEAFVEFFRRLDSALESALLELGQGRLSRFGVVRWWAECWDV